MERPLCVRLSLVALITIVAWFDHAAPLATITLLQNTRLEASSKRGRDGFIRLFDGYDLKGWQGLQGYWSVRDGAISGHETKDNSKQTFLVFTGFNVKDFDLRAKYRFASTAGNSGIQFRSKMIDAASYRVGGYQADFDAEGKFDGSIYDEANVAGGRETMSNRGEATIWSADEKRSSSPLVDSSSDLAVAIRRDDWNDIALVAEGTHITYRINGHLMTDLIDNSPASLREGLLAIQLHVGYTMDIRIKDLRIKVL